ncbi:MAG: rod-binding protein [Desulfobulbaceae bacterium]|nr:rod-binding protein [Desulfobulbaceae bacterium]HIJ89734.1 flagellar biosynthesis protein FlgJ [Deltaproteobacteria bacterium]
MDIISEATTGLKGITNSADTLKEKKLREACAGFEALMLKQILSQARQGIEKSGLLDGGYGEEMFQSIQDDQMTQKMAGSNALGFGEMLYRQLSQAHVPPNKEK